MRFQPQKVPLNCLLGKTLARVLVGPQTVHFQTVCGSTFTLGHEQQCCETVYVELSEGDQETLLGEVTVFELVKEKTKGTMVWAFYKLTTKNGYNTFRFTKDLETFYSVDVDFCLIDPESYPK